MIASLVGGVFLSAMPITRLEVRGLCILIAGLNIWGCGDPTGSMDRGPMVREVSPAPHVIIADRTGDIVVTFDRPVARGSVTPMSFFVFGRWSGVRTGRIEFEAGDTRVRLRLDQPLASGEWVTVQLSTAITDLDGEALGRGFGWNFWTAAGAGTLDVTAVGQHSVRLPGEGRVRSYGAYGGDLDGDGFPDLAIPNEDAVDVRVMLNTAQGDFGEPMVHAVPGGSVPSTNDGADVDRDGWIDLTVGNSGSDVLTVFRGDGTGRLEHLDNYAAGQTIRGLCVGDLNADGYPDVVTANQNAGAAGNLSLFLNDGSGTMAPGRALDTQGGGESSCVIIDANDDGAMDVAVGALDTEEIVLLLGDGTGGLAEAARVAAGGGPWMIAAGDVNGDGAADIVSANVNRNRAAVVLGDGEGNLTPAVTYVVGGSPLAIDLGDLDGDGDLDLVTSNFSSADFTVLENDGAGVFGNARTLAAGTAGSCTVLHDRDGDGDLDITGIDELDDLVLLFRNGS